MHQTKTTIAIFLSIVPMVFFGCSKKSTLEQTPFMEGAAFMADSLSSISTNNQIQLLKSEPQAVLNTELASVEDDLPHFKKARQCSAIFYIVLPNNHQTPYPYIILGRSLSSDSFWSTVDRHGNDSFKMNFMGKDLWESSVRLLIDRLFDAEGAVLIKASMEHGRITNASTQHFTSSASLIEAIFEGKRLGVTSKKSNI